MASILKRIFGEKAAEVAASRHALPEAELRARALDAPAPRDFRAALRRGSPSLIAEIKRSSPSEGLIRPDFDVTELAQTYAAAGAHALSVLTESRHFGGALENLGLARQACDLPLLRKDFLAEPYQVWEARAAGADAILIILAGVEDDVAKSLLETAHEAGLAALVETHDAAEIDRALALGAEIVGVNARDLSTFQTDLARVERLIPALRDAGKVTVAESALHTAADVARMRAVGADAVLIGTAFMREPDVAAAVRRIMGAEAVS